jgi:hypothetical protein
MKHRWNNNFKKVFGACGRSDITPMKLTRSVTIDISVKWRMNQRKRCVLEPIRQYFAIYKKHLNNKLVVDTISFGIL